VCQNQGLHYTKGDTWDRMLQQGIQLLDRFCQAAGTTGAKRGWMDQRTGIGEAGTEVLLQSALRFFKFLPGEERQTFLRHVTDKAS